MDIKRDGPLEAVESATFCCERKAIRNNSWLTFTVCMFGLPADHALSVGLFLFEIQATIFCSL